MTDYKQRTMDKMIAFLEEEEVFLHVSDWFLDVMAEELFHNFVESRKTFAIGVTEKQIYIINYTESIVGDVIDKIGQSVTDFLFGGVKLEKRILYAELEHAYVRRTKIQLHSVVTDVYAFGFRPFWHDHRWTEKGKTIDDFNKGFIESLSSVRRFFLNEDCLYTDDLVAGQAFSEIVTPRLMRSTLMNQPTIDIAEQVSAMHQLFQEGVLTSDEFHRAKELFIGRAPNEELAAQVTLRNLKQLKDAGILTEAEFSAKKWQVLSGSK